MESVAWPCQRALANPSRVGWLAPRLRTFVQGASLGIAKLGRRTGQSLYDIGLFKSFRWRLVRVNYLGRSASIILAGAARRFLVLFTLGFRLCRGGLGGRGGMVTHFEVPQRESCLRKRDRSMNFQKETQSDPKVGGVCARY